MYFYIPFKLKQQYTFLRDIKKKVIIFKINNNNFIHSKKNAKLN